MRTTKTSEVFNGEEGGTYYFRMRARDAVMNEQLYIGGKGDTQTTVDTKVPSVTWADMPSFQDARSFVVRWIGTDHVPGSSIKEYTVQVKKEGGKWTNWLVEFRSSQSVYTADADTTYSFRCRATDNAGNQGDWSEEFTVRIDATPPVMQAGPSVTVGQSGAWEDLHNLTFGFAFTDPESSVRTAEVGIGTSTELFDVVSPTSFEYPTSGELTLVNLDLKNSVRYYIGIRVENQAGAWTEWVWSDEFLVAIPGPEATISYPTGIFSDNRVLIEISVADPRGYNITLGDLRMRSATEIEGEWPWSDWERVSNARGDTYFEAKRGFRYQFKYRAQNELGSWGEFTEPVVSDWLYVNNPPVANGGIDQRTKTGEEVQFSAEESSDRDGDQMTYEVQFSAEESSDRDGDQMTYSWDFGDGSTATGLFVSHKYDKSGLYTVKLTVDDGHEQSTARVTVYVEKGEETPGFGGALSVLVLLLAAGAAAAGIARSGPRRS
jgi:PKD repeat protein